MTGERTVNEAAPARGPAGTAAAPAPAAKWVNAGPDEGALHALLAHVAQRVPHERIDVLWIFPPRVAGSVESTVVVIAGFDADAERRTVATAHFRVSRDRRGRATVDLQMQEHGTAPVGATQRVVDGVLRRLGDEVGREAPRRVEIAGNAGAWWSLYQDAGGEPPEEALALIDEAARRPADEAAIDGTAAEGAPPVDDAASTPPHGDVLGEEIAGETATPKADEVEGTPPHDAAVAGESPEEYAAPESYETRSR